MKNHRALIGAWFKRFPVLFFCSEEINDFQPVANCRIQNVTKPGTIDAKIILRSMRNYQEYEIEGRTKEQLNPTDQVAEPSMRDPDSLGCPFTFYKCESIGRSSSARLSSFFFLRQLVKGGIPPAFVVKRGCRQSTAAGGAPTHPKLPQIQF